MQINRPEFHFTPESGWINDPNGPIYVDGRYHVFCQHYPDDTHWGPMHWLHAVSDDLLNWETLPIALVPTEDEYCFSGSAIIDKENCAGFGKDAMLLFYTAHNPKTGEQEQCVAWSTNYIDFKKYENNPVIINKKSSSKFKPDFRDPKVIKNEHKGGFTMVLAAGDNIDFYHSKDLLHWTYSGCFTPKEYGNGGICECPDLIHFEKEDKYVLTMSMVIPATNDREESHVMQYFVGEFDGDKFINAQEFSEHQVLDFGPDNYAMVTFANTDEKLAIGWGEDWNKARENKNEKYFGKLTLARKLKLITVNGKYYVSQTPVAPNAERKSFENKCIINDMEIPRLLDGAGEMVVIRDKSYTEVFADDGLISYSFDSV